MFEGNKIKFTYGDMYGKYMNLTDYLNIGDEFIINEGFCYLKVSVVNIYAGVTFYIILKKLKKEETSWEDISDSTIYHIDDEDVLTSYCIPTEVNLFDWFHEDILNIYTPDDLYGEIKINYKGKFKNEKDTL